MASRRHAVTRHRPAVLERVRALLNGRTSRPEVQADGGVVYNVDVKVPPSVNKRQVGARLSSASANSSEGQEVMADVDVNDVLRDTLAILSAARRGDDEATSCWLSLTGSVC